MGIGVSFIGDRDDMDVDVGSANDNIDTDVDVGANDNMGDHNNTQGEDKASMIVISELMASSILEEAEQELVDTHRRDCIPRLLLQSG